MLKTSNEIPSTIRNCIRISTAFVAWVTVKSWLNPLDTNNLNNYYMLDPELLNATGMWTIPACFGVIVYFIIRYYEKKAVPDFQAQ